jgi:hypothetical protein
MSIKEKQNRLRAIATDLKAGSLTSEDRDFLCGALFRIADGEDAKTALAVKARRGERSSKASHAVQKMSDSHLILALGWIKVAITPEPDGLGLKGLGCRNIFYIINCAGGYVFHVMRL